MKFASSKIILAWLLVSLCLTASMAQAGKILTFAPGETLVYEGKLSKIISGITIADLTFAVSDGSEKGDLLIQADARSKGTLLKIARYSFLYHFSSNIDGTNFRIERTSRNTS